MTYHFNLTIIWKNDSFIHSTASCGACPLLVLPLLPSSLVMTDAVNKTIRPACGKQAKLRDLHEALTANKCKYTVQ